MEKEYASLMLSEVMDEIGVNEEIVMKRRRTYLLREAVETLSQYKIIGIDNEVYHFGSQIEGTTTKGLLSDSDALHLFKDRINIIQDLRDWKPGVFNLLMIQDDMTSPGYCLLQILRIDAPLPACNPLPSLDNMDQHRYSDDKIVLKHSVYETSANFTRNGPAFVCEQEGYIEQDLVCALPLNTIPRSLKHWLQQKHNDGQISDDIVRYILSKGCYVVPTGRKGSPNETLEWRISTSHAERCVMFSLNITQIRCYVLMKMLVKTYLNLPSQSSVSSFICKNILLNIVAKTRAVQWNARNLIDRLKTSLCNLKECIKRDYCPHFIMQENNLLLGKFSANEKKLLLDSIDHILQRSDLGLFSVKIDELGERLFSKLSGVDKMFPALYRKMRRNIFLEVSSTSMGECAAITFTSQFFIFLSSQNLLHALNRLESIYERGSKEEQEACILIKPLICSSLGCELASNAIQAHTHVTREILEYLKFGTNSDISSGRLKLASVLYNIGDVHGAELALREINILEFYKTERDIHDVTALNFAVMFRKTEIHCLPKELRYEMFKSTQVDVSRRSPLDWWIDLAVVDSLAYLYFLQYKVYAHLQKREQLQQALIKLARAIDEDVNLRHKETALNLLGQCMEQENRPAAALNYYILSLRSRPRNNAAIWHILIKLNKEFSKMKA